MYADAVKQYAVEHGLTESEGVNFSAEITHQLVDNLNDLGIETHGSKDMEEDLRRREDDDAIFAVDYVPLTDDEKEDVFSYLDDEHDGRGIVIGDKNIYLVDHAGNEVKRGKGGIPYGFQCIFKIAIDGLSSEQIQKVAKLIKDGRFKNQGSVDLWVKANLDQSGRHSSDSIVAKVGGSNEDHDRLHLETQTGESIGGRGNQYSEGDLGTDFVKTAFAGSQLTFAHGIRRPHGEDLVLLSSAIMTQSNTFGKLTSELADKNDGTVVKKVILYGNHAYLWSTENGYEFFVEQSLAINEENYQKINDLLDTYGTDEFTAAAISGIQRSGDKKTGSRSLADFAKRERSGENSGPIGRNSRRLSEISNGTGTNEYNLSDTQGKTNFITPQGQVYGYATPEGAIYLDERVIKKSRTCVRDFFIKACPPGQPDCLL